ncbi:hypothetical protein H6G06_06115 [Anabaena sphaerica FACHB-251]|uniref:Uncharacterized protein n=1 Tax=Anabaena sphaerica FACHB-251 TaxID=2692883 RepID=A0A926WEG6_9NOST|nr:hypothetical protein [Anabaena sphaerica FACHB-251]
MVSTGRANETCLHRLLGELRTLVGNKATLQSQAPITLPQKSEPEPDFAIINNRDDHYLSAHPTPDRVWNVVKKIILFPIPYTLVL